MRILVTGGAGFIGSYVAAAYLEHGHEVLIVDHLSTGKRENIPAQAIYLELDLLNRSRLEKTVREFRPEVINHHAAHTSVRHSWDDPAYDARNNILGSLNLLELAVQNRTRKVIYASSGGAIYGEPEFLPVSEGHPIRPISNYGVSKYAVELYLRSFSEAAPLSFVALRYPNVYGPRQDPQGEAGVVAIFAYQLLTGSQPRIFGSGTKTRDYIYVDDIVEANLRALDTADKAFLNLGWGREISDQEVFDTVQAAVGSRVTPSYEQKRPGEVDHICLDSSQARELLGWEPRVAFADGVQHVVAYWKQRLEKQHLS